MQKYIFWLVFAVIVVGVVSLFAIVTKLLQRSKDKVGDKVENKVDDKVENKVDDKVENKVDDEVENKVDDEEDEDMKDEDTKEGGDEGQKGAYKGIVFFDIDGTITTATGDKNRIIQTCIDRGYLVGVATGGPYAPREVVKHDWFPTRLRDELEKTDFRFFNSTKYFNGKKLFPDGYPSSRSAGYRKGYTMISNRNSEAVSRKIPDARLVLFDDDPEYLDDVVKYNPGITVVCAGAKCGGKGWHLTAALVQKTLDDIEG